jgi:hypothetical protein
MLAGSLPFGRELLQCVRFEKLSKWTRSARQKLRSGFGESKLAGSAVIVTEASTPGTTRSRLGSFGDYPDWFFPKHFSMSVKHLLASLLDPDPAQRLTISAALHHSWVKGTSSVPTPEDYDLNNVEAELKIEKVLPPEPVGATGTVAVVKDKLIQMSASEPQEVKIYNDSISLETIVETPQLAAATPSLIPPELPPLEELELISMPGSVDTDRKELDSSSLNSNPFDDEEEDSDFFESLGPAIHTPLSPIDGNRNNYLLRIEDGPDGPSTSTALAILTGAPALIEDHITSFDFSEVRAVHPSVSKAIAAVKDMAIRPKLTLRGSPLLSAIESEEVVARSPKRTILCSPPVAQLVHQLPMDPLDLTSSTGVNTTKPVFSVQNLMKPGNHSRGRVYSHGFDTDSADVPLFSDTVKRSTRFYTTVPASDVLHCIANIIAEDEYPLVIFTKYRFSV